MKQILSCIQPTGNIHFGNYFGAIQNWVKLQEQYKCLYGIVDYHAMTMPYDPDTLRKNTYQMAIDLMACGIKAENVFIQSLIPEHTELCWILSCFTSFGELSRMTQFKDKSKQIAETSKNDFISTGLFTYPVLQAADILIYHADYVPVGKDQEQHLELSRNISVRFNQRLKKEYFVHPEPLFAEVPKLLSLADPTKKMSKSLGEKHYIALFGDEKRLRKKVRSAVTDSGAPTNGEMSAGVKNLFELLKVSNKKADYDALMDTYKAGNLRYGDLKAVVADALVEITNPFKEKRAELMSNRKQVKQQLQESSATIRLQAQKTLKEVRQLTGLPTLKNVRITV